MPTRPRDRKDGGGEDRDGGEQTDAGAIPPADAALAAADAGQPVEPEPPDADGDGLRDDVQWRGRRSQTTRGWCGA
jgi:hypothetical protein